MLGPQNPEIGWVQSAGFCAWITQGNQYFGTLKSALWEVRDYPDPRGHQDPPDLHVLLDLLGQRGQQGPHAR